MVDRRDSRRSARRDSRGTALQGQRPRLTQCTLSHSLSALRYALCSLAAHTVHARSYSHCIMSALFSLTFHTVYALPLHSVHSNTGGAALCECCRSGDSTPTTTPRDDAPDAFGSFGTPSRRSMSGGMRRSMRGSMSMGQRSLN
jgi:hypothetical protein